MKKPLPLGRLQNGLYYTLDKVLLLAHDDKDSINKERLSLLLLKTIKKMLNSFTFDLAICLSQERNDVSYLGY